MSEKPILFNDEMVTAILDGRKTQTRRRVKNDSPPYSIGDILYVREAWLRLPSGEYEYRADYRKLSFWYLARKWRPSIHMPKSAARILLRVRRVAMQNITDISEVDAKAEGVTPLQNESHQAAFLRVWNDIYGDDAKEAWVIEFERVEE